MQAWFPCCNRATLSPAAALRETELPATNIYTHCAPGSRGRRRSTNEWGRRRWSSMKDPIGWLEDSSLLRPQYQAR